MASPVFHGLAGAGLAWASAGDGRLPPFAFLRKNWGLLLAGVGLACLPDVDYLPGLWRGYLNTTHQQATHSVAWVLLVCTGLWLAGRAWKPERCGWRAAAFLLILVGSHLAIDLVTQDRLAPYGIPLGWPFLDGTWQAPWSWLPAWDKTALADLGSWRNLRALAVELAAGSGLAAGCVWAKRGWTRGNAPL